MSLHRFVRCRPAADQGFTLIEVLVAVAIVAVALGAGMKAAGALTLNAQRLADVSAAQWCADNHLTNIHLSKQYPDIGDSDFTCEQMGVSYAGKQRTSTTPNPNFRRVEVTMAGSDGYGLVTISTVMARY